MRLRIPLTFLAVICFVFSQAQVRLAVFAGPQTTSANYKVNDRKQPTSWKYGVMGGAGLKVPFDNHLYFFPVMYYSLKGYKVTLNDPSFPPTEFAKNNNTTIHTVEIAPLFQIDFSFKPSHPFVRFGPSIDFAFSGRERFDTSNRNGFTGTIDRPMVFSFGDYGRITSSLSIQFGYEMTSGLSVFGFYNHGLGSLNNADDGPVIVHRIGGIAVGWLLGKKATGP